MKTWEFLASFTASLRKNTFVCFLSVILAACSILYELILAQTISLLASDTVVWYSVTIGLFLMGMGIGSFLSKKFCDKFNPWLVLLNTELLLSIFGASSAILVHLLHIPAFYFFHWKMLKLCTVAFFGGSFLLIFWIGILTGIELPVLMTIAGRKDKDSAESLVLGMDYFGSLIGAIAFPILLYPYFELIPIGLAVALINLLMAALIIFVSLNMGVSRSIIKAVPILGISALIILALNYRDGIQQYFLQKFYFARDSSQELETLFKLPHNYPKVVRMRSPNQTIDVRVEPNPGIIKNFYRFYSNKLRRDQELLREFILTLSGDFQFNSSTEEFYHEYFAHVPIQATGVVPKQVLVVGGGDGLLIRELLKYKEIKHIKHIDLDGVLVNQAKTNRIFLELNKKALLNSRVETIIGDGYYFLRNTRETFDAIYIDLPIPADYNLAKLYSKEFYAFVRRCLKFGGMAVFDAGGIEVLSFPDRSGEQKLHSLNQWPYYYNTLKAAGFSEIQPFLTKLDLDWEKVYDEAGDRSIHELIDQQVVKEYQFPGRTGELMKLAAWNFLSSKEGFIMMGNHKGMFSAEYRERNLDNYVFNRERFYLALEQKYPTSNSIDWTKVNSILRPTFPSFHKWLPRFWG